jgi:RNA polymerase sigma-70 factor (subfamily 1)
MEDKQDPPPPSLPASKPKDRRATATFELPEGFRDATTEEAVERAQSGDLDALNLLFERYHRLMVEVARRKLGPRLRLKEDPVDLAQTTFREATRDFKNYQYRGEGSLLKWLTQILQNKIRDKAEFYSAGKRDTTKETALDAPAKPGSDSSMPEPAAPDLSVTGKVQREESFGLLRAALAELTPEYRQAITLVFFQGLSLREAGEQMGGRSEDALRMMLRRAEAKLGERLKRTVGEDMDGSFS